MAVRDEISFWEMYRELPVRTTLASVVPVLLGLAQLLNGYVHGVSVTRTGTFAVVMAIAAVLVTQYHLVEFHRVRLQRELYGEE
jgi:hypothetical protein